ncbi:ribonucleotide reductase subunit alpha [Salinivibrio sp. MA351]|uniref:ribonucleotide reductase subunit alpha n=1 Tax=Salinivibrio sp. MA351 TaxID=1909453 RepID=UPI00098983AE|nr:ribonucleotide reductase subunit alpha [Salinivibrio sp. MA351]OOE98892.1 ribonucleotide reductase subunit alpha [Salinivibrio sp. MA351]
MQIASYKDLIAAASMQSESQRLLFVFAKAELPEGHTTEQKSVFQSGKGGALTPVLCVDKLPKEVETFSTLVAESLTTGFDWDVVFISALDGRGGYPPNSDQAQQPLRMMLNQINEGKIGMFITANRNGDLISLNPA